MRRWISVAVLAAASCGESDEQGSLGALSLDAGAPSAPDAGGGAGTVDAGPSDGGTVSLPAAIEEAFDRADMQPGQWTWIPVEGARCRDGSRTGFLVRTKPAASRWVIYLQGGGACFNPLTCASNRSSFSAVSAEQTARNLNAGIFDDLRETNPVKDWSFAFIPYCTGDVFAGTREDAPIEGVGGQDFVGARNVERFVELLHARYGGETEEVLVTGVSAGGFGAALNFDVVAERFTEASVHLLDDSGQPLPYGDALAPCLVRTWFDLWGVRTPPGCATCAPEREGLFGFARHITSTYPGSKLGLTTYTEDPVIRGFLLFGRDDCEPRSPFPVSADAFRSDLFVFRAQLPRWGTFYVDGRAHTFLNRSDSYAGTQAGGATIEQWLTDFLADDVRDLGP